VVEKVFDTLKYFAFSFSVLGIMSNLFSQSTAGGSGVAGEELPFHERVEEGVAQAMPIGQNNVAEVHTRKFPFNRDQAIIDDFKFGASFDRSLMENEALSAVEMLLTHNGLDKALDGAQKAFVDAMFLAHTKNSASILMPGRAEFWIETRGQPKRVYNYFTDVVLPLGDNVRRFFRAYADEVRAVNRRVLAQAALGLDLDMVEHGKHIRQVAASRGLHRHPDLCHDTSDHCTSLSVTEFDTIRASSAGIFASQENGADMVRLYREKLAQAPLPSKVTPAVTGVPAY